MTEKTKAPKAGAPNSSKTFPKKRKGSFIIKQYTNARQKTGEKETEVSGWIVGPFGLWKEDGAYRIYQIHSGMWLLFGLSLLTDAMKSIEALTALPVDWYAEVSANDPVLFKNVCDIAMANNGNC